MKLSLALAALCLASGVVRADLVIVQQIDGMGQSGQMTMKIGPEKIRTDMSPAVSMLTDIKTGDVTTIMHAQKAYMIVPAATSKAMADEMRKLIQMTGAPTTPGTLVATGSTEKINGYTATIYSYNSGFIKGTYWVSNQFPNWQAVTGALNEFQKGGLADMTKAFAPDLSTLPGAPVKTEMEINGQKMVTQLLSATDQKVDPADYQVPAAYTQMTLPPLPAMPGTPASAPQLPPAPTQP